MFEFSSLLAFGLFFLGSFVQTAIGFGLAVVSAPLLIVFAPQYVPAPICLVALFISLLGAIKHRSNIEIGGLKMAVYGRIPGSLAGGLLLMYVSTQQLSLWVGGLVLCAVGISTLPFRLEPTPKRMVIAGFFSGFFGTSSGIGGPPMALLLQHQDAAKLRGNLSAFFVLSSLITLIILMPTDYLNLHHLVITLPLLPAAYLGYLTAIKTTQSMSKQKIRIASLTLCAASGMTAICEGIHAYL